MWWTRWFGESIDYIWKKVPSILWKKTCHNLESPPVPLHDFDDFLKPYKGILNNLAKILHNYEFALFLQNKGAIITHEAKRVQYIVVHNRQEGLWMAVVDFHSHILPTIDDGSKNMETSLRMLDIMREQGVDYVVATPHFYAYKDRVESFLLKRQQAYQSVMDHREPDMPRILLGAEVAFFSGISRAEKIDRLTVEGTRVLLLEMPFDAWKDTYIDEVEKLIKNGFTILLAHLERYLVIPENKKKIKSLLELPLHVQINAGSMGDWKRRRELVRMFRDGSASVLGSDCHGVNHRAPNLIEGRRVLEKKLGKDFLEYMDAESSRLLKL